MFDQIRGGVEVVRIHSCFEAYAVQYIYQIYFQKQFNCFVIDASMSFELLDGFDTFH